MSPKEGRSSSATSAASGGRLGWVDPAAAGANVGRRPAPEVSESPASRLERAAIRFNGSEAARTVGGLMRTLGRPSVSVGAAAGSPSEVRITVAWDLCWYQWGVDLGDDLRAGLPDRPRDRDRAARRLRPPVERVGAGEGGRVALGAPAARAGRLSLGEDGGQRRRRRQGQPRAGGGRGRRPGRRRRGARGASASGSAGRPTTSPSTGRCCSGSSGRRRSARASSSWSATRS